MAPSGGVLGGAAPSRGANHAKLRLPLQLGISLDSLIIDIPHIGASHMGLNPFDKASVQLINQYKDGVEVVAFRNQMKRICELAGINYELEKSWWWRKYHQQKDKRD